MSSGHSELASEPPTLTLCAEYDNSVKYLSDFLQTQERPFDGVIGFSQGAAMTAALTALVRPPATATVPPRAH